MKLHFVGVKHLDSFLAEKSEIVNKIHHAKLPFRIPPTLSNVNKRLIQRALETKFKIRRLFAQHFQKMNEQERGFSNFHLTKTSQGNMPTNSRFSLSQSSSSYYKILREREYRSLQASEGSRWAQKLALKTDPNREQLSKPDFSQSFIDVKS